MIRKYFQTSRYCYPEVDKCPGNDTRKFLISTYRYLEFQQKNIKVSDTRIFFLFGRDFTELVITEREKKIKKP